MSCVTVDEVEKEAKKRAIITKPPNGATTPVPTDGSPFVPHVISVELFRAFLLFLTMQKGRYEFLYRNSMDRYRDIVTSIDEMPNRERALRNEDAPLLSIDYQTCAYESFDPAIIPGGNFSYAYESPDFRVAASVSEALNKELTFQFGECLPHYFVFIENPFSFLYYHAYCSLFDKQSGGYALFTQEGKKGIIWHFLKPDGRVFSSLLSVLESEKEEKKWQYIVTLPDERNIEVNESKPYRPKVISFELFQSFYGFIKRHEKQYDSLYTATAKKYKDIVSLPPHRTPVTYGTDKLQFYFPNERK
jgi:hypothetical protein